MDWFPSGSFPYCSDFNLIERFSQHLKGFACANRLFASISALSDHVRHSLEVQNDSEQDDRFF